MLSQGVGVGVGIVVVGGEGRKNSRITDIGKRCVYVCVCFFLYYFFVCFIRDKKTR